MAFSKVLVLDTTLREGEQAPNIVLSAGQRIEIGNALSEIGVDFIEIAPIVGEDAVKATKELMASANNSKTKVIAHGRAFEADIDILRKCDVEWGAIFLSTSQLHMTNKLHLDEAGVLKRAEETVTYAKQHGLKLRFTCEDATRTDNSFLRKMIAVIEGAGAERISITDTVGASTPEQFGAKVKETVSFTKKSEIDVHCHNDLGLALPNAISGLQNGATCVHVTINGVGERSGIPSLAETVMALKLLYKVPLQIKTENLTPLSNMLTKFTGVRTDPFKPIVGENAFRHKGGTHLAAVLSKSETYEVFSPESVGNTRRLVLGEYSGKNVLKYLNEALGMNMTEDMLKKHLKKIKGKKGDLFEFEL
ncbi:(R)-citramalate synthase CimA [Candidatus Gugararchaeum adminiculabundum]|nr:(R)-citramalate synthase CimA [Candidatus Gugararchaeum adminiculabundum]